MLDSESEWKDACESYEESLNDFYEWANNDDRLNNLIEDYEDLTELNEWDLHG